MFFEINKIDWYQNQVDWTSNESTGAFTKSKNGKKPHFQL